MHILAAGRALPSHRYPQSEITEALAGQLCPNDPKLRELLESFHRAAGVEWRNLARPLEHYASHADFKEKNDAYIDVGLELGEAAIREALDNASLAPENVDAIFFVSVTGIAVPTLDARLITRLGLRNDIKRYPLFGLGCVAGAAGIARVNDYLQAWPDHVALLVAIELCSLTLQPDDLSIPNLIGSGLFGDGAAAVVGVGNKHALASPNHPEVLATRSRFYPRSEDAMGWDVSGNGFRLLLSASVPSLIRENLRADVDEFLASQGTSLDAIGDFLSHTGGPRILIETQRALELKDDALEASWRSLRETGNMSSVSVLFILAEALEEQRIASGSSVLMLAMGPGFCAELVLMRW